jgi:uncharacterized Zn finger protein (UPF0148 family)
MIHCPFCKTDVERRWKNGPTQCKCGVFRQIGKRETQAQAVVSRTSRRDVTKELADVRAKVLAAGHEWGSETEKAARLLLKEEVSEDDVLTLVIRDGKMYRYKGYHVPDVHQDVVPDTDREAALQEFMNHARLRDVVDVLGV